MWYDEIPKSDKNNNFKPKYFYDLSYFQFQTDLFFILPKITAFSHNVKKEVSPNGFILLVKGSSAKKCGRMVEILRNHTLSFIKLTIRDVRSAGIPIPMGSHSHSPEIAHSRGIWLIPGEIPIPGKFPFFTKFEKNWKKMIGFETKPLAIIFSYLNITNFI